MARKILVAYGQPVPESDEETLMATYELLKERDFLEAHEYRLNKDWRKFTKLDWQEIIAMSGQDQITTNIGAFMACMSYGLLIPKG